MVELLEGYKVLAEVSVKKEESKDDTSKPHSETSGDKKVLEGQLVEVLFHTHHVTPAIMTFLYPSHPSHLCTSPNVSLVAKEPSVCT